MTLAELFIRLSADTSDFGPRVKQAQKDLDGFKKSADALGSSMADLGMRLTAAVSIPLAGVSVAALKMANSMEQASMAFKTMMGSSDAAKIHLEDLKKFAAQTPFEFADLVLASKRMQALGFTADQVIPSLRSIGNAAAALGSGKEGIDRITTALGQMMAKGKVQAEEMRQLAEAGIPAWKILAATLNTDVAGAMKLVEQRAVDASVAVPALLAGMTQKFGGLMEQQMQTIGGMWSNLKDQIGFTLADIGKAMTPWAKDIMVNVLTPMLDRVKELAAGFAAMGPKAQTASLGLGALAIAGPPLIAALGYMIQGIGSFGKALSGVIPLITSPAGIAVAVGVTLVGALSAGYLKLRSVNEELNKTSANSEQFQRAKAAQAASGIVGPVNSADWNNYDIVSEKGGKALSHGITVAPMVDAKDAMAAAARAAQEFAAAWSKALSSLGIESSKFREMESALAMLGTQLRAHGVEVPKTTSVYWLLNQAVQAGILTADQAAQATSAWTKEWQRMHPVAVMAAEDMSVNRANVQAFDSAMRAAEAAGGENWVKRVSDSFRELTTGISSLPPPKVWFDQVAQAAESAAVKVQMAFLTLGIKSQEELQETAREARKAYDIIASAATSTALDIERAWVRMIEAQIAAGDKLPPATLAQYEKVKAATGDATKRVDSQWKAALKQVSTAVNDLSRSLTDVIFGTKSIGEAFTDLGKTIVRIILEQIIANGISKLMSGLEGLLDKLGSVGKAFGGIFGTASTSAGAGVGSSISSAGGGGGAAASALAGGASGVGGIITMITQAATAVSSIIGNFQMMGMNKTLDLIEASTRYTWLSVGSGPASISEMMKNLWAWAQVQEKNFWSVSLPLWTSMTASLEDIAYAVTAMRGLQVSGGSGMTITVNGPLVQVQGGGDPNAIASAVMKAIPTQLKKYTSAFAPSY